MAIDANGNVGIGTTAPAGILDVKGDYSIIQRAGLGARQDATSGNNDLQLSAEDQMLLHAGGLLLETSSTSAGQMVLRSDGTLQLDTSTNNTDIQMFTGTGTLDLSSKVTTGSGSNSGARMLFDDLTTGVGLLLDSDSSGLSSGNLLSLDWSPDTSGTLTGDLFKINVGANALVTGEIFAIQDNTTDLFTVNQTRIESAIPHSFTAAGDVSMAYDQVFTNQTASKIESYGPLTIESGEAFENNNLTLKLHNLGELIVEASGNQTLSVSMGGATFSVSGRDVATFDRKSNDGTLLSFKRGGTEQGGVTVSGTTVTYGGFTGSHYAWTDEEIERGMIVTMTGDNRYFHGNPGSEILYGVKKSSMANDPKLLGAYLSLKEPSKAASLSNPHLIMAVGNADMWVVDRGENLEVGDYLISSSVNGHAMKDNGQFPVSYVFARVAEPVNWDQVSETIDGQKRKRISVFFESFENRHGLASADQVDQLAEDFAVLESRLTDLSAGVDSLGLQLDALTGEIDVLSSNLAALTSDVEGMAEQFSTNTLLIGLSEPTDVTRQIDTASGAYLSEGGSWTNASSRDLKENFQELDRAGILERIKQLEITKWNYRSEGDRVVHIGPFAEQFHELFGVGSSDSISTIDPAGIALLGIQALAESDNKQQVMIDELRADVDELLNQDALVESSLSSEASSLAPESVGSAEFGRADEFSITENSGPSERALVELIELETEVAALRGDIQEQFDEMKIKLDELAESNSTQAVAIANNFPSYDDSLVPGTVVALRKSGRDQGGLLIGEIGEGEATESATPLTLSTSGSVLALTRTTGPDDLQILGIVLEQTGLGEASVITTGKAEVQIAPDSPEIRAGDWLVPSATYPGLARKATSEQQIILGRALESLESTTGFYRNLEELKVTMLVDVRWAGGGIAENTAESTQEQQKINGITQETGNDNPVLSSNNPVNPVSLKPLEGLTVTGLTNLAETVVGGSLTVGSTLLGEDSSINTLGETLKIQPQRTANVSIFGDRILMTTDGNLIAQGEIIAAKVTAGEYAVLKEGRTIGDATIPAGQTTLFINAPSVTRNSRVFTQLTSSTPMNVIVSHKQPGRGFEVTIPTPTTAPIKFDYWIVQEE